MRAHARDLWFLHMTCPESYKKQFGLEKLDLP
uniref:Uncharacterized protein n=1 Tax=Lepeophtheirus salmonis TaxID=72036 RepID=A0A0K2SYW0_LEPSM